MRAKKSKPSGSADDTRPIKPLPSRQRKTSTHTRESLADKELNASKDSKFEKAVQGLKHTLSPKTHLSRKDRHAKEGFLKQIHVALIVDQVDRVYCVPCEKGIEVSMYKEHEEGQEHQDHILEWKRKCLHFSEKMNYKYIRTEDLSEDGKLIKSKMIYEPVKPELDLKEFVSEDTFALRLKLKKLDKAQQKKEVDRTDAVWCAFKERLKKLHKEDIAKLKPELLNRPDVASILNESDRVYCIPCKEGVDVLKHNKHEEGEEHKAHTFEWKRECLHLAEKMNYKCLRADDKWEDGKLVKSNVIYEAVRPEPTEDFNISLHTFAFKATMEAELRESKGKKALSTESPRSQTRYFCDWTDPVSDDDFVENLEIGISSTHEEGA
ncbi:hypothetical protein H1R20_g7361, partial [Candolleomyces eurysporus]